LTDEPSQTTTRFSRREAPRGIDPATIPASAILAVCLLVPALILVYVSFFKSSFAGIEWTFTLDNYRRLFLRWTLSPGSREETPATQETDK